MSLECLHFIMVVSVLDYFVYLMSRLLFMKVIFTLRTFKIKLGIAFPTSFNFSFLLTIIYMGFPRDTLKRYR